MGFSKNMAAIKQHAIAEKRASEDMYFFFSFSPYSCFGLNLSKLGCKDQESIQSSTTPDPGYQ